MKKRTLRPFGSEFLEEMAPQEERFGAHGTSVCSNYTTVNGTKNGDNESDGCTSDTY